MRPFPEPHAKRHMALAILAEGPHLCLQLIDGLLEGTEPVAAGIVPGGREDHCRGEQLGAGQAAFAPRDRVFILRQTPAGIEGLTEDPGLVARHDRLEPHLGRDGVNADGAFHQRPGRDRIAEHADMAVIMAGGEMALPVAKRPYRDGS